jgi:branched-chain amino acid transport system permease protein
MIILGGLGSIRGVIVGAAAVTLLRFQFLPDLSALSANWGLPSAIDLTKYQPLIFGLILIVMMIYRQDGLIPATRRKENIAALEGPPPVPASGTGTSVAK